MIEDNKNIKYISYIVIPRQNRKMFRKYFHKQISILTKKKKKVSAKYS